MNVELQELGTSLAIGIYVILALDYLLYPLSNSKRFPILRYLSTGDTKVASTEAKRSLIASLIIAGVAALSLGILADRAADTIFEHDVLLRHLPQFSESQIKKGAIFEGNGDLTRLGRDLKQTGLLERFDCLLSVRTNHNTLNDRQNELALDIYYYSKNLLYSFETYYDELSRISVRRDFIRSFAVLTFSLGVLALFVRFIPFLVHVLFTARSKIKSHITKLMLTFGECLFCIILSVGMAYGYAAEELTYVKRVYGYVDTLVEVEKLPVPQCVGLENADRNLAKPHKLDL